MKKQVNPLSARNILSFIGANLTLGSLLGWSANFIQVLTFTNGLLIFGVILVFSLVMFAIQLYNYQNSTLRDLKHELDKEREERKDIQKRLDRLVVEFRSRSAVNPRPLVVNALICTKKLQKKLLDINVTDVTSKILVIDKGESHGLAYGMSFAVYVKGDHNCLETCVIDRIESTASWLLHSGSNINKQISAKDLSVQVVIPSDVQDSEREIAEILLIAAGYTDI